MFEVELKSKKLQEYIKLILGKKKEEAIMSSDLDKISSLKIDKSIITDLSLGEITFFKGLTSLSLNSVDIGDEEISLISRLSNIKTLSISNAEINLSKSKYLNLSLQNLIFVNCKGLDINQFTQNKGVTSLTVVNCQGLQLNGLSQFEELREVNLPQNEELLDKDIEDLWKLPKLEKVNLDGNQNISDTKHEGIEVSHREEYTPTESSQWNAEEPRIHSVNLSEVSSYSSEQLTDLKGVSIIITAEDMEFLKSDRGQEILGALRGENKIVLSLNTTADLSMEDLESIHSVCDIDKVQVNTGWKVTQDKGYSYEIYKAIKQEILNIVDNIDPNMSEQEKYLEVRKRLTGKVKYDYAVVESTAEDHDYYASRNLENGLLNNTCVCAGYADILKNVLAELGIESIYVEGRTDSGECHAWNQVRLRGDDGQYHWYNDDVTWDAVGKNKLKYALLDDEEFSKTHKCSPSRTEGGQPHMCDAKPPLAIRLEKNKQKNKIWKRVGNDTQDTEVEI